MRTPAEIERDKRNIRPTAPARVAMTLYNERYAAQRGGSMDFWDNLTEGEKETCTRIAEQIREAPMHEGRGR
jgi:hypothetical protein